MPDITASSLPNEIPFVLDLNTLVSGIITSLEESLINDSESVTTNNLIIDSIIGIGGNGGRGGAGGAAFLGNGGAGGGGGNGGDGIFIDSLNSTSLPNAIPSVLNLLPPFSIIITPPAGTTNNPDTVIINNFIIGSIIGIGGDSGRGGAGGAAFLGNGGAGGSSGIGGDGIFINSLDSTSLSNELTPFSGITTLAHTFGL